MSKASKVLSKLNEGEELPSDIVVKWFLHSSTLDSDIKKVGKILGDGSDKRSIDKVYDSLKKPEREEISKIIFNSSNFKKLLS